MKVKIVSMQLKSDTRDELLKIKEKHSLANLGAVVERLLKFKDKIQG